jgi:succinate-acetate transporter protein
MTTDTDSRDGLAPENMTRIVLRPMASGLPLGFFAFGTGTILLTSLELKWVPLAQDKTLMLAVLLFVVPLELLAGIFAFLTRDSGVATGLCTLSAAWGLISVALLLAPPGSRSSALGIFLLTLATLMLLLFASSLQGKPLFGVLLLIGACRFALTGVYEVTGTATLETASGWLGLVLVAFCLYGGLALLLEEGTQHTVLPLLRRGRALASLEGDLGNQIQAAEREPGVRRQL